MAFQNNRRTIDVLGSFLIFSETRWSVSLFQDIWKFAIIHVIIEEVAKVVSIFFQNCYRDVNTLSSVSRVNDFDISMYTIALRHGKIKLLSCISILLSIQCVIFSHKKCQTLRENTAQGFSTKGFFNTCEQIRNFLYPLKTYTSDFLTFSGGLESCGFGHMYWRNP